MYYQSERMKRINNMRRRERRTKIIFILALLVGYLIIIEKMVGLALLSRPLLQLMPMRRLMS